MILLFFALFIGLVTGADTSCSKITAYFNGTFKDLITPSKLDAQLLLKLDINMKDKRIHFHVDHYNNKYQKDYKFSIWNKTSGVDCLASQKGDCSIPIDGLYSFLLLMRPWTSKGKEGNLDIIWVNPLVKNQFTLKNAKNNCATNLKGNDPAMYPGIYKHCFCCGDKYNPHPSLGCPTSPWH